VLAPGARAPAAAPIYNVGFAFIDKAIKLPLMLWWWARGMHVHNKHAEPAPDSAILAILVDFLKFLFLEISIFRNGSRVKKSRNKFS
jgi:hypothetical protein